jgi:hypothetical protein
MINRRLRKLTMRHDRGDSIGIVYLRRGEKTKCMEKDGMGGIDQLISHLHQQANRRMEEEEEQQKVGMG